MKKMVETFCLDVNQHLTTWGGCLRDTIFFGSYELMALIAFVLFALVIYKTRLPGFLALPMGTMLTYGLYVVEPTPVYLVIFLAALIVSFGWFGKMIVDMFKPRAF